MLSVSIGPNSICFLLAAVVVLEAGGYIEGFKLNSLSLLGSDDRESVALDVPSIDVAVVVVRTGFV